MNRLTLLAGALALSIPSLASAQSDPSNPAAAPVSPSLDRANQPTQAEVPSNALPADARDAMENTPPLTGDEATAAEAEAERAARADAARPKAIRSVRIGERTVALNPSLR